LISFHSDANRFVLVQSLVSSATPVDPLREIEDYCRYFDNQYGSDHPAFYRGRLQQVNSKF